jgi:CheY-like chemotaxis protein
MSNVQKILVADDSLTIRKLVETILHEDGYQVITAETGAQCLQQAAAQKPNLILLDYILPDMQGTEICRRLINSPETWEVPVLMMSSNGNAIRQLYQDLNNVTDYLTKPFAPNVLKAVVGHLLQKDKPAPATEPTPHNSATAPANAVDPSVPKDLMDKVSRLLSIMESQPASAAPAKKSAAPSPSGEAAAPTKAPSTRSTRKSIAASQSAEVAARKFRTVLQKHLRARAALIPDWEHVRGSEEPETFYLTRLLTQDVLWALSADLVRASGMPASGAGAIKCSWPLVALDAVLQHLHDTNATGELQLETDQETVLACVENGDVVLLTTNHPRNYCAGAAFDFQAAPHAAIGEAVRAQEEHSVPFFVTLQQQGQFPAKLQLQDFLKTQGEKCLLRAFKSSALQITFWPLARLSPATRSYRSAIPLKQLLLACYRTVDDWFTLEKIFPSMDATLAHSIDYVEEIRELKLNAEETSLLQKVRNSRTLSEVAEAAQLKPYEVCRVLYRFIKLGLIRQGVARRAEEQTQVERVAAVQETVTPVIATPTEVEPVQQAEASSVESLQPAPTEPACEISTSQNSQESQPSDELTPSSSSSEPVPVAVPPHSPTGESQLHSDQDQVAAPGQPMPASGEAPSQTTQPASSEAASAIQMVKATAAPEIKSACLQVAPASISDPLADLEAVLEAGSSVEDSSPSTRTWVIDLPAEPAVASGDCVTPVAAEARAQSSELEPAKDLSCSDSNSPKATPDGAVLSETGQDLKAA